jgi:ABC-2 type transport system permease protein
MTMRSKGFITIAGKEFSDHLYGRTFLLFLSIIIIVTIIGMAAGSVDYNNQIDSYNEKLVVAGDDPVSGSYIFKPSVMTIFDGVGGLLVSLGAILGIAMGFNLVTKEKESKSLKILLSNPIYRDEVINGKAAGGILALVVTLFITLVISLGVMLLFGIVPSADDIGFILLFGVAAFLMIFSYFAISMFMSTVAEDSGTSLVYTLIIFVFLSSLVPVFVWGSTIDMIVGPAPEYPEGLYMDMQYDPVTGGVTGTVVTSVSSEDSEEEMAAQDEAMDKYFEEMDEYWSKKDVISGFVNLFSPTSNFKDITNTLTYSVGALSSFGSEDGESPGIMDVLGKLLWNFIALIAIPVVFFGGAYVRFMRLDVR